MAAKNAMIGIKIITLFINLFILLLTLIIVAKALTETLLIFQTKQLSSLLVYK